MSEENAKKGSSKKQAREKDSERFRRLLSDQEKAEQESGNESLGDTQPSKPTKLKRDRKARQGDQAEESETGAMQDPEEGHTPAPPPLGETPVTDIPKLDDSGMPLPQRVPERDVDATQVVGSAFFQGPT